MPIHLFVIFIVAPIIVTDWPNLFFVISLIRLNTVVGIKYAIVDKCDKHRLVSFVRIDKIATHYLSLLGIKFFILIYLNIKNAGSLIGKKNTCRCIFFFKKLSSIDFFNSIELFVGFIKISNVIYISIDFKNYVITRKPIKH